MQAYEDQPVEHSTTNDLIALISGSPTASVRGFMDSTAIQGDVSHPATPFIAARQFDRLEPLLNRSAKRWRRAFLGLTGLGVFAVALALGMLAGLAQVQWAVSASEVLPKWKMVEVVDRGVMVSMGGRVDLVPTGGRLPNGDAVISVIPGRGFVMLESGTAMLIKAPQSPGVQGGSHPKAQ